MNAIQTQQSRARSGECRRNCWTCGLSGPTRDGCEALTLDEDVDAPVLEWLAVAPMGDDGTVPVTSDGCPAWVAR